MLEDRARQLRKAIPAGISELSEAVRLLHKDSYRYRDLVAEAKMAAKEMALLAQALAAAAQAASDMLEPKPPDRHDHYHGPTINPPNPSGPVLPPGSPPRGIAPAATVGAQQE